VPDAGRYRISKKEKGRLLLICMTMFAEDAGSIWFLDSRDPEASIFPLYIRMLRPAARLTTFLFNPREFYISEYATCMPVMISNLTSILIIRSLLVYMV
jgi:hypothetical protein